MKENSLKVNFVLQTIYQIIILVVPLILAPYLTRTLGDTALGEYTFSYTIAYYFVVFSMLGISKYGQRAISTNKADDNQLKKTFWSLYILHSLISVINCILYLLFIAIFCRENISIYLFQGLFVLSALFDITWLFYGLENFKKVVFRNALINILQCVCIFVFVKSMDDLWRYTFIKAGFTLLSQLIMWPYIFTHLKPTKISFDDIFVHIKPMLVLSTLVVSSLMYSIFDKTLLGVLSTKENVAYYEYSSRIIDIPKMLLTVTGTILFPRACLSFKSNDSVSLKKYFNISLIITLFVGFGAVGGLFAISDEFSILYFGENFARCGEVMKYLSPLILLIGLGSILQNIFIIPSGKELVFTIFTIIGAMVNVILSAALIPTIGIYGAIIGSVVAEFILLILQFVICKKFISIKKILLLAIPFLLSSSIMCFLIVLIKNKISINYASLVCLVLGGMFTYIIIAIPLLFAFSPDRKEYVLYVKKIFKWD